MPELVEPAEVRRPKPSARWDVNHVFAVYRFLDDSDDEVRIHPVSGTHSLRVNADVAAKLGAAITAAAHWTPEPIVDAEIVDDRPRYTYDLIRQAVDSTRPRWMSHEAAQEHARAILGYLVAQTELNGADE